MKSRNFCRVYLPDNYQNIRSLVPKTFSRWEEKPNTHSSATIALLQTRNGAYCPMHVRSYNITVMGLSGVQFGL